MSADSELPWMDIAEAARRFRARDLSPVDLTRACLERIERHDTALNACITVTPEAALEQARTAEAELARGVDRGPLHGVPVGLKDLIDTAGVRTTGASGLFAGRVPTRDAEVVRRLRAAGAVLIGKLNLHELAYGASSVVGHFGPVRNPWAPGHTAGGSSSGSAAALAAGFCLAAVGTDTGGSIRQPAAFCGVVGLKPTFGRVSVRGVLPLAASYDHVGPMARSVRDTALLFEVLAGHDPWDPTSLRLPVPAAASELEGAERLRLGVARAHFFEGLDPEVAPVVDETLRVLTGLVADVREVAVPAATDTALFRAEIWARYGAWAEAGPHLFQPETLRRIRAGAAIGSSEVARARADLARLRADASAPFADVDVVVTPTSAVPPFAVAAPPAETVGVRELELVTLRNTRPFNALGLPAVSVPCGFTRSGLPVGLQLVGPPGGEAVVLRLAHALECALGSSGPRGRRPPLG